MLLQVPPPEIGDDGIPDMADHAVAIVRTGQEELQPEQRAVRQVHHGTRAI